MPAGRPLGSKNGTTASAKAAVQRCFEEMGGVMNMLEWAKSNQTDFYRILYAKLIPLTVGGDPDAPLEMNLQVNWCDKPTE